MTIMEAQQRQLVLDTEPYTILKVVELYGTPQILPWAYAEMSDKDFPAQAMNRN